MAVNQSRLIVAQEEVARVGVPLRKEAALIVLFFLNQRDWA